MNNNIVKEIDFIFDKLSKIKDKGGTDKELFEVVVYMLKTWKNDEIMREIFRKNE